MKILAFGASNSSQSINQKLALYIASQFENSEVEKLDLNDYEMAIYSIDKEINTGIPSQANDFARKIDNADLVIISLAEYNGTYSVGFKNIFDWVSRIPNRKAFNNKRLFLAATSPGERGASTVLESAKIVFPFHGGDVVADFSLPFFDRNFVENEGILDETKKQELAEKIEQVKELF